MLILMLTKVHREENKEIFIEARAEFTSIKKKYLEYNKMDSTSGFQGEWEIHLVLECYFQDFAFRDSSDTLHEITRYTHLNLIGVINHSDNEKALGTHPVIASVSLAR